MRRNLFKSFLIVFCGMLIVLFQNCHTSGINSGGSTTEDPMVMFAKYNPILKTADQVHVMHEIRMCIKTFHAYGSDNTDYILRRIFEDVTLDPNGTLVGFLDEDEIPEGEYTVNIMLGDQCASASPMFVHNSHGEFSIGKPHLIKDFAMTKSIIDERAVWSVDLQGLVDELNQAETRHELLCQLIPDDPNCE